MKFDRIPLSSCSKVKDEADIPGNFTSVAGEYFVPSENRTGFYKLNSSFGNNPDLRELLASTLLKAIDVPVADVLLVRDEENQEDGCMSMNILKDGERFLEEDPFIFFNIPAKLNDLNGLDRFIAIDLYNCSSQYKFTPELLAERKEFLINYAFISAFLGNDDIKTGNCQVIYNEKDGSVRNPEYYDMGMSFEGPSTASENQMFIRYFFTDQLDTDVLRELYEKYPKEVEDISKRIEKNLNKDFIQNVLGDEVFKDFGEETIRKIWAHLGDKITYVSKQNELLYGVSHNEKSFVTSIEEVEDTIKGIDILLIDTANIFLQSLKQKTLGEKGRG